MHAFDLFTRVRDDLLASAANQKWTDAQVYRYLNRAYLKVWGEQVTLFEAFGMKRGYLSLVASTELYSLPVDCKKLVMVEYLLDGNYYPIKLVPFEDLSQYSVANQNIYTGEPCNVRYFELGNQIGIAPIPQSSVASGLRITYYAKAGHIHSGTLAAAAATTVTLATGASDDDDAYNDQYMTIVSGTGAGQKAQITDYVGSTKVATVTFSTPPTGAVYAIWPKIESEMDELVILQADRDLCVVHDPGAAKMFAELYAIERKRRVDEMYQRNTEVRMVRYVNPDK